MARSEFKRRHLASQELNTILAQHTLGDHHVDA